MPGCRQLALAMPLLLLLHVAHVAAQDLLLTNLRPSGIVEVEVYADAASWRRGRHPIAHRRVAVSDFRLSLQLQGLPEGRYAIRAYQAADRNTFERWPASLALSRRGYSRWPLARQAPVFERAAVELRAGVTVPLRLNLSED